MESYDESKHEVPRHLTDKKTEGVMLDDDWARETRNQRVDKFINLVYWKFS